MNMPLSGIHWNSNLSNPSSPVRFLGIQLDTWGEDYGGYPLIEDHVYSPFSGYFQIDLGAIPYEVISSDPLDDDIDSFRWNHNMDEVENFVTNGLSGWYVQIGTEWCKIVAGTIGGMYALSTPPSWEFWEPEDESGMCWGYFVLEGGYFTDVDAGADDFHTEAMPPYMHAQNETVRFFSGKPEFINEWMTLDAVGSVQIDPVFETETAIGVETWGSNPVNQYYGFHNETNTKFQCMQFGSWYYDDAEDPRREFIDTTYFVVPEPLVINSSNIHWLQIGDGINHPIEFIRIHSTTVGGSSWVQYNVTRGQLGTQARAHEIGEYVAVYTSNPLGYEFEDVLP